jgi:signal transduction histidine kinase
MKKDTAVTIILFSDRTEVIEHPVWDDFRQDPRFSLSVVRSQEEFDAAPAKTDYGVVLIDEPSFSRDLNAFLMDCRQTLRHPVIVLTGEAVPEKLTGLLDSGAMDCIHTGDRALSLLPFTVQRVLRDWTIFKQTKGVPDAALRMNDRQRQLNKLESLGRLAGGVAHDFNNILMVINGFATLLEKRMDPGSSDFAFLVEIKKAGQKAAELTRQLLAFSRKQRMTIETTDLNSIIRDAVKLLNRIIGENITLEMRLDPDLHLIRCDISQIDQIIINLATNARDAMPDGGTLLFETRNIGSDEIGKGSYQVMRPDDYVLLHVADTGIGMDRETRQSIFEPFFTTKQPGAKGTGLGLATVYGTIKQLEGYIFCESQPGEGTEFFIFLPLSHERTPVKSEEMQFAPDSFHGTETLLLTEDEDMVRSVIRRNLEGYGYTVLEARNAAEALELIRSGRHTIDLLITDVLMPGKNGVELAYEVHALIPDLRILFISGYNEDSFEKLEELPARWKLIQKPIKNEYLIYIIRSLLES